MKLLLSLIGCLLSILLSSCSYYEHYVKHEQQLKACHLQCNVNLDNCKNHCRNNIHECETLANLQAATRFKKYKKQQLIQGIVINEELQSFKDPLQCRKVTCSCQEDYRVCKQSCRGKIYKNLKTNAC